MASKHCRCGEAGLQGEVGDRSLSVARKVTVGIKSME